MVRYTNPGIAREMSTANLNSGQPYQRPVKPSDVNALIRRWDPAYLSPIEVSFRDGSYNVINGQHRIEAMRKMNGGADVPFSKPTELITKCECRWSASQCVATKIS